MLKLKGRRPTDLGARDGRFTAKPTWKPNWVSSQVEASDPHHIAPIPFSGDAAAALAGLKAIIAARPRTAIVTEQPGYLHAEFSTPLMGYVDDFECVAGDGVLHVRSSSRLGIRDFDVNRKRVESLRRAFSGG